MLFWSEDPSGLVAAHFASIFFGTLALEGSVSLLEAYALALFSTQVGQIPWYYGWGTWFADI